MPTSSETMTGCSTQAPAENTLSSGRSYTMHFLTVFLRNCAGAEGKDRSSCTSDSSDETDGSGMQAKRDF